MSGDLARLVNVTRVMENGSQEWLVAAACHTDPRPAATFADLPQAHRYELIRLAVAAAGTTAFLLAVNVLMTPLPSRSLAAAVAVMPPAAPRHALTDARAEVAETARAPRTAARAASTLAAVPERQELRGNIFTRFFRAVVRRTPAPAKVDPTS